MFGMDPETAQHLILFIMLWSLVAGVCIVIGRKKGISVPVAILGSFPFWLAIFFFWLLRQPDVHED